MTQFKNFILKFLEDFLISVGLLVIVYATFRLSLTAGLYCLGAVLLILGIYFAIHPVGRRNDK